MDLKNSDACDGRAQQTTAIIVIAIGVVLLFFILREVSLLFFWFAFGEGFSESISNWIDPLIIFLTGGIFASTHQKFWVSVEGNRIHPAIDIFFPKKLSDGSTRFTVFTSGFAVKLPWISLQDNPIEIEKRRTEACDDFTVTVTGTSLEIKFKVAWKPHIHFLSTYLQNATTEDGENDILKQIIAQTKQLIEEECAGKSDPEEVRMNQSAIIDSILDEIQVFAEYFGIDILNISFSKCDYSDSVQKTMDKQKESEFIAHIRTELIRAGVEPGEAGRLAAVQAGVANVTISDQNFGGLEKVAKIFAETIMKWRTQQ